MNEDLAKEFLGVDSGEVYDDFITAMSDEDDYCSDWYEGDDYSESL